MPTIDGIVVDGQTIDTIVMPNGEEISVGGVTPTGNKNITSAGVTDVAQYATATVAEAELNTIFPVSADITWGFNALGSVTASYNDNESINFVGTPGFVDRNSTVTINAGKSATYNLPLYSGTNTVVPSSNDQTLPTQYCWMRNDVKVKGVTLQSKTVGVSESARTVTPDSGYVGLSEVNIAGINSNYVGSSIPRRVSSDLTANGATVTAPNGYYVYDASLSIPSGTEGTPTATKSAVSNNSITVTPSVTNTAGVITGGTHSGTPVTVSASELVSGTKSITQAGVTDVTNYATATVPSANPLVDATSGFETVEGNRKWWYQPGVDVGYNYGYDEGYLETGVYLGNKVSYNAIPTGTSVTPTESAQTIGGANTMMEGAVTVNAIPSTYVGTEITRRDSTDLTASGATVSVPSGFYENNASKSISTGSIGTASFSFNKTSDRFNINTTKSITGGYIQSGSTQDQYAMVLQELTVTPTESTQTVTPQNNGYYLNSVTVNPIPSEYIIPSGTLSVTSSGTKDVTNYASASIPALTLPSSASSTSSGTSKATISRSTSNQYINIPTGFNNTAQYYTISATPNGTEGTPTAAKGSVSNHSVAVTPSVTNSAGYISGGTKTGTAVTVSASELVSGTKSITQNGTTDVTNYASVDVIVPESIFVVTVSWNSTTQKWQPDRTFAEIQAAYNAGKTIVIEANASHLDVQVSGEFVERYTAGNENPYYGYCVTEYSDNVVGQEAEICYQYLYFETGIEARPEATSIYVPSITATPATVLSGYTFFDKTNGVETGTYVPPAPSLQAKTNIAPTTSSQTITADSGYDGLSSVQINAMPSGSASPAATISATGATVSTGTNTLTLSKTVSNTPQVTAGYVSAGTTGNSSVSLTASVTTKAAATITPTTTNQTIASGTYLTGMQTIPGDANLVGSNIISGKSIFGVAGTVTFQTIYSGSSAPSSSTGANGDIYIRTG